MYASQCRRSPTSRSLNCDGRAHPRRRRPPTRVTASTPRVGSARRQPRAFRGSARDPARRGPPAASRRPCRWSSR